MIQAEELGKRPSDFLRTTGINYATFQIILAKAEAYVVYYKEQHPIHKRGLKPSITLSQILLLTLMYMRQYQTFLSLAQAFSISESYAYKRYCYMRQILCQVLDMPPTGLLVSDQLTKVAVDVSEQTIERPLKGQQRYYSGKKKAHHQSPASSVSAHRAHPDGTLRKRQGT